MINIYKLEPAVFCGVFKKNLLCEYSVPILTQHTPTRDTIAGVRVGVCWGTGLYWGTNIKPVPQPRKNPSIYPGVFGTRADP